MKTAGNIRTFMHYRILTVVALAALAATNALADKYKANNTIPLNQATSWTNNAVPTSTEFGVWDTTVTTPNTTNSLGVNGTWGGIKIINPGGPILQTAGYTLTLMGVSGTGIDMSSATQDLTVNCALSLPTSQSWNVAYGRTLTVSGPISGLSSLTKTGSGVLVLSGASTYTGNTTVAAGRVLVNGSLAAASTVTVLPGATLGGTLTVTNLGPAPQAGDTFTLFTATTYSNSFATLNLPALGTNLVWDTSTLAVDGTARLASATVQLHRNQQRLLQPHRQPTRPTRRQHPRQHHAQPAVQRALLEVR
jgi:autotransporter-associated beta strand protein